mmetsp:Transcript_39752/g.64553  ORF Transcript_39752/g.64553 Transcript_39752/m.64553 type:complete len:200 (+) Transcript_39752:5505-6104(+)
MHVSNASGLCCGFSLRYVPQCLALCMSSFNNGTPSGFSQSCGNSRTPLRKQSAKSNSMRRSSRSFWSASSFAFSSAGSIGFPSSSNTGASWGSSSSGSGSGSGSGSASAGASSTSPSPSAASAAAAAFASRSSCRLMRSSFLRRFSSLMASFSCLARFSTVSASRSLCSTNCNWWSRFSSSSFMYAHSFSLHGVRSMTH